MTATSGEAQPQALTLAFVVGGAAAAIEFYTRAFGAQEYFSCPTKCLLRSAVIRRR
jgi:hypothetical protein